MFLQASAFRSHLRVQLDFIEQSQLLGYLLACFNWGKRSFPVAYNLSFFIRHYNLVSISQIPSIMPSRNPTGFDVREFKAAAHPRSVWAKKDPWARYEAWRYTGPFSRWNRFKGLFPGLGTATVLFAGYCVYEQLFLKEDHGHGHEESHH